jgi:hypothetical protein
VGETIHLVGRTLFDLLYQPRMTDDDDDECRAVGGMSGRENRITRGKTCPSGILSTTNPIQLDPGSNLGRRGGKPATNRLTYGTSLISQ